MCCLVENWQTAEVSFQIDSGVICSHRLFDPFTLGLGNSASSTAIYAGPRFHPMGKGLTQGPSTQEGLKFQTTVLD